MGELLEFGKVVLLVAAGFSLALASSELTARFPLPRPALFLFAAALASDLFPSLAEHVSIREVERIGVVALIVISTLRGTRCVAIRDNPTAVA